MRMATSGALALFLGLAGCSLFEDDPYSGFLVGDVDESEPEREAAILVGDPQVISRETLINDRLREVAHIEQLLRESKSEQFTPQVLRDLSVMQAFTAQLGISFNPALGAAFERQEEVAELKSDIEIFKLRNELAELRKLQAETPDSSELAPTNVEPGLPEGVTEPSAADIQTELTKAIDRANEILQGLTPEEGGGPRPRKTAVTGSPEERFEDLNAYRARLRQRQSEVALDDAHDAYGNTLYRLQFAATVLPGEIRAKFGVLDFEIVPAVAKDEEIEQLYEDWLIALMFEGLESRQANEAQVWERTQSSLIRKQLVNRVLLFDFRTRSGGATTLTLFVHPDDQEVVIDMINDSQGIAAQMQAQSAALEGLEVNFGLDPVSCRLLGSQNYELISAYQEAVDISKAKRSIRALEVFISTFIVEKDIFDPAIAVPSSDHLKEIRSDLFGTIVAADSFRKLIESRIPTAEASSSPCLQALKTDVVPDSFVNKVTEGEDRRWTGEAFTYQAQPTERVQRLSTLASAVNSMQAAFSLAATIPGSGIGINAGAGAARTAAGTAEAIERTPLVIGYTNRRSDGDSDSAEFGYVFGPKAVLDPAENQLEYRQIAASHAVFADVSVPAWWPAFDLKARSAWAANWHEGSQVLGATQHNRNMQVRLRPERFGYSALTSVLAGRRLLGTFESVAIKSVEPESVSACVDDIEFVVKGRNLWRGATAFLRGQRHKSVAVLPDMGGIAVTFDIDDLPAPPTAGEDARLIVWTSFGSAIGPDGFDGIDISILESRKDVACPTVGGKSGAVVLAPAGSRLIGGSAQKLRINLKTPLPAAKQEVKVIAQVIPHGDVAQTLVDATSTAAMPGRWYEGTITVAPPAGFAVPALDGAPLRVGLSYKLGDTGAREPVWADKAIVFYPNTAESQFKVETGSIDSFGDTVSVELPARLKTAYPDFAMASNAFAAVVSSHETVPIQVIADWRSQPGKVVLSFVKGLAEDATKEKEFGDAWCANNLTVQISVADEAGSDPPGFVSHDVPLKQKSC